MARENFVACLKVTLVYEGGYSNHPKDPGGVTLEGVIQTVYNAYRTGKGLTRKTLTAAMRGTASWIAERNEIYKTRYWDVLRGDDLPFGVDLAAFDFGVNSGPSRSAKYLQDIVGVVADGRVGAVTLDAVRRADGKTVIQKLCGKRLTFLQSLNIWNTFKRGWSARVAGVEAKAVAMWLSLGQPTPAGVRDQLDAESKKAATASKAQGTGAGTLGTGTGGAAIEHASTASNPEWLLIGVVGVVVVVIAVILAVRAYHNFQRSKAYAAAAAAH